MRKFLSILLASILLVSLLFTMAVPSLAATKVKTTVTLSHTGTVTLTIGQVITITATVNPAAPVAWSSKKAAVAAVDANGNVTAQAEGTTTIIAKAGGKSAKVKVKVVDPNKPTKIIFPQGKSLTVNVGSPVQLTTALEPANAKATLTWKSSKPAVATVDGSGVVTPVAEGKAKITVTTHNKKKATIAVTVVDPYKPTGVTLAQGKAAEMTAGQTLKLTPVLAPATAKANLTWKSSKPAIATVDANGVVTALGKGKVKITAQDANYKKVKTVITINVAAGAAPVDGNDLSAWLDKPASAAESALGLKPQVESSSNGVTVYKLTGNGFYMAAKGADYASATISMIAIQGQGKSDRNICGFNANTMTYEQAIAKAKADKWTIKNNDDFGGFRALIITKNGKWMRITDNSKKLVSSINYQNAN